MIEPLADDVIHWRRMVIPGEHALELPDGQKCFIRQGLQGDRLQKMLLNIGDCFSNPKSFIVFLFIAVLIIT